MLLRQPLQTLRVKGQRQEEHIFVDITTDAQCEALKDGNGRGDDVLGVAKAS